MNPELVLVVSDMFVPYRVKELPEQFKTILTPNKISHVLTLGNIGSNESYDWLKSLSNDFNCVKGDYDTKTLPERKIVNVGEFKLGMIHGHQILPWDDINAIATVQRQMGCDILFYGNTHKLDIQAKNGAFFINPGSISGAFSDFSPINTPSFILMVVRGNTANIYAYYLNDLNGNFEVKTYELKKGDNEIKEVVGEPEKQE